MDKLPMTVYSQAPHRSLNIPNISSAHKILAKRSQILLGYHVLKIFFFIYAVKMNRMSRPRMTHRSCEITPFCALYDSAAE